LIDRQNIFQSPCATSIIGIIVVEMTVVAGDLQQGGVEHGAGGGHGGARRARSPMSRRRPLIALWGGTYRRHPNQIIRFNLSGN
jgi:hypothetical protein